MRHNALSNVLLNTFHRAGLSSHLEVGSGLRSGEFKDPSSRHPSHQLGQRHLSSLQCHGYIPA